MWRHVGKGNKPSHCQKYFSRGVAYSFHIVLAQQHVSGSHVHPFFIRIKCPWWQLQLKPTLLLALFVANTMKLELNLR